MSLINLLFSICLRFFRIKWALYLNWFADKGFEECLDKF